MRKKNMFWAILFIAVGVILLIQTVFNIELPIVRILIGLLLIYMGFKMITKPSSPGIISLKVNKISSDTETIFTQNEMKAKTSDGSTHRKFSTVFGSSNLDLRGLTPEDLAQEIKIENAFGRTLVKTDNTIPIKANVDTGFASVSIRGQKTGNFGDSLLQTTDYSSDKPAYKLNINAAFGEVIVE